jgi:serine/threonine protein kinase
MANLRSDPDSALAATVAMTQPQRLGRYEILCHIATGGMAEIYLARATGLEGFELLAVVKQIRRRVASNREFVEMFLDEARVAATLRHPNVVHVYDVGMSHGVYYFAMEFLHGQDASMIARAARLRRQPVPLEHVIGIAAGTCAGLHYAHEKMDSTGRPCGIVHRDISPQNVFVTFEGGIKIIDFGIAKAANRLTNTRHGVVKGKLRYLSPEQAASQPLDRRSDIFSLGTLLWELLTGRRLFHGRTEFDVLRAIVKDDAPAPSTFCLDCPPELDRIILRALHRQAAERYQSAEELQLELEAFARSRQLAVSTVGLSRYLKDLFAEQLRGWQQAERAGEGLARHIARVMEQRYESSVREDPGGEDADVPATNPDTTPTRPLIRPDAAAEPRAQSADFSLRSRDWLAAGDEGAFASPSVVPSPGARTRLRAVLTSRPILLSGAAGLGVAFSLAVVVARWQGGPPAAVVSAPEAGPPPTRRGVAGPLPPSGDARSHSPPPAPAEVTAASASSGAAAAAPDAAAAPEPPGPSPATPASRAAAGLGPGRKTTGLPRHGQGGPGPKAVPGTRTSPRAPEPRGQPTEPRRIDIDNVLPP